MNPVPSDVSLAVHGLGAQVISEWLPGVDVDRYKGKSQKSFRDWELSPGCSGESAES